MNTLDHLKMDADLLTALLNRQAQQASDLAKIGICTHGHRQTYPNGTCKCLNCGKLFATYQDLLDEERELLI